MTNFFSFFCANLPYSTLQKTRILSSQPWWTPTTSRKATKANSWLTCRRNTWSVTAWGGTLRSCIVLTRRKSSYPTVRRPQYAPWRSESKALSSRGPWWPTLYTTGNILPDYIIWKFFHSLQKLIFLFIFNLYQMMPHLQFF